MIVSTDTRNRGDNVHETSMLNVQLTREVVVMLYMETILGVSIDNIDSDDNVHAESMLIVQLIK